MSAWLIATLLGISTGFSLVAWWYAINANWRATRALATAEDVEASALRAREGAKQHAVFGPVRHTYVCDDCAASISFSSQRIIGARCTCGGAGGCRLVASSPKEES